MLLMRENPPRGQVGGGWALEIDTFMGPVKWHRAVRRMPVGSQKSRNMVCISFSNGATYLVAPLRNGLHRL
jgi:hypothetical protein